jgi:hypothetical protein
MKNYAAGDPVGNNQQPIRQAPAPYKAIARYAVDTTAASSVISLSENTTAIEIGTGGAGVVMRWVATSDTQASVVGINGATSNFDHLIPANTVRRFVVPIETAVSSNGSVQGANRENGLYQRVAVKPQGTGSVLVAEYGSSNAY